MRYSLPRSLEVNGQNYPIRSDYRAVLDVCAALSDDDLTEQEKGLVALSICYPTLEEIPTDDLAQAMKQCFWFINCGEDAEGPRGPKLVDWEQDFKYIVAPINRVMGQEIRAVEYLHWWTFISAYYEIGGECMFAQIVQIRDKKAKGKALDKSDREWYRRNRHLVDFKRVYTDTDDDLLKKWGAN